MVFQHQLNAAGTNRELFGCEIGQTHFSYLGLNVGINHRRANSWSSLVEKIRMRLAKWNDKHISFGGRITLIQAVLSSIPIYCLSFFIIPMKTCELKSKTS